MKTSWPGGINPSSLSIGSETSQSGYAKHHGPDVAPIGQGAVASRYVPGADVWSKVEQWKSSGNQTTDPDMRMNYSSTKTAFSS